MTKVLDSTLPVTDAVGGLRLVRARISLYYRLAKPGIVYGNALSAIGGFLFAARGHFYGVSFFAMLLGLCLVMASACVCNNFMDRTIDKKMARTKNRSLVLGDISPHAALIFAILLGAIGTATLLLGTNRLTALLATAGFFFYVVVYGWGKRVTVYGTLIGSISGAIPPVVGYVSVINRLDGAALLLFLILASWQMPHFYAIALFRRKDYAAADIPVLPVVKGLQRTKVEILVYSILFTLLTIALCIFGYASGTFALGMGGIGLVWVHKIWRGFTRTDTEVWARQIFGFSLITLLVLCAALSVDAFLPY